MHNPVRTKWIFLVAVMAGLLLSSGCALWDRIFPPGTEDETPAQLMIEGTENMNNGYYMAASEAFQKIRDRYPYSKYAVEAELKMADALYESKHYEEAIEAYDTFEKLHPKHPEIPYVIYKKGMSHFSQVKSIDRDQSHTHSAKEEFTRLIRRFPEDAYAKKAEKHLRECYISLAEHELYVGHFYFNSGDYRAAMNRYRYVLENYPDLGQYHIALEYLRKSKTRLDKEEPEGSSAVEARRSWWDRLLHPFQ